MGDFEQFIALQQQQQQRQADYWHSLNHQGYNPFDAKMLQLQNMLGQQVTASVTTSVGTTNPAVTHAATFVKRSPEETWLRTRVHEICWNPS